MKLLKTPISQVSEEGKRSKKTLEERDRVEQQLQDLTKDKISLEKKLSQINVKLKKVSAELKEEREVTILINITFFCTG